MQIDNKDIRPGDFLLFKRNPHDKLGLILSLIIKLFYPRWDRWGWHTGVVVWNSGKGGWVVLEAAWPEVRVNPLSQMGEYRAYRWFDEQPDHEAILRFMRRILGRPYDILKYIWTIAAGILYRIFRFNLGTWENDEYYCWEIVEEFAQRMGKPLTHRNRTLLLPDIQKILEK